MCVVCAMNRYSSNFLCSGCLNCLWHYHMMFVWWVSMHVCIYEFERIGDFCHLDASLFTHSHMRTVSKTKLRVCVHCKLKWDTAYSSLYVQSDKVYLLYRYLYDSIMWCDIASVSALLNLTSIHPSIYPSFDSMYCWSGTNIAEFAIYMAFALSRPLFCLATFVHSWTNFSLKYLYTRNLLTLG